MNQKILGLYMAIIAGIVGANFSSQDSTKPNHNCSARVTYYNRTKAASLVDMKIGSTKGSSTNDIMRFYMIPNKKGFKASELAYDELKLKNIQKVTTNNTSEQEIIRVENKDYIVIHVTLFLQNGATKTLRYMVPNDLNVYGRKKGTGAMAKFPISSVSSIEMEGCIEEGVDIDVDQLCKSYAHDLAQQQRAVMAH